MYFNCRFPSEHRKRFQELRDLDLGEVRAFIEDGRFRLTSDEKNTDLLRPQFQVAAEAAARDARAPSTANLIDWWILNKVKVEPRGFHIDGLIQQSITACCSMEADFANLADFRRSRYPQIAGCSWLYIGSWEQPSDPVQRLQYWEERIWAGFGARIKEAATPDRVLIRPRAPESDEQWRVLRRRWVDEAGNKQIIPKDVWRSVIRGRLNIKTCVLQACVEGLAYDLAVIHAHNLLDRGLEGQSLLDAFAAASLGLVGQVESAWEQGSNRLCVSWRKQRIAGFDPGEPFRKVMADLQLAIALTAPHRDTVTLLTHKPVGLGEGEPRFHKRPNIAALTTATDTQLQVEPPESVSTEAAPKLSAPVANENDIPASAIEWKPAAFPNRAKWLERELEHRQWTVHELDQHGGPNWKTSRKILDGEAVMRSSLEKIPPALSAFKKRPRVSFGEIPVA